MGITMIATGGVPGDRGAPLSFSPEGRTYSPPARRVGGGTAASHQPCALRGGLRSLRRAPDNAAETAVPVIIVCAEESMHRSLRLRKPAPGSFIAIMDDASLHRPFSFVSAKETKPPLARGRKDVIHYGDLSSGSEGRQSRRGTLGLRGLGLYELLRHLQRLRRRSA